MRIEVVRFECDWCSVVEDAKRDDLPEGWGEVDHEQLCAECFGALTNAINEVKSSRTIGKRKS